MENRYFSNNATTSIVADNGSTITVNSTALFPSLYPFVVTIETAALVKEIVKVTGSPSANVWSVIRSQEGTITTVFPVGTKIEQRITAGTLTSLVNEKADLVGANFTGNVKVKTDNLGSITIDKTTLGSLKFSNTAYDVATIYPTENSANSIFVGNALNIKVLGGSYNTFTVKCSSDVNAQSLTYTNPSSGVGYLTMGDRVVTSMKRSGSVLPTSDIGPIWHEDYNTWMIWQTFDQNGAAYSGYASVNIGQFMFDPVTTGRTGSIKTGVTTLSKVTYAALWNWALHTSNAIISPFEFWVPGKYRFADNGDGTFRVPDLRGEFLRIWDDSRGVDSGRAHGGWQASQFPNHDHIIFGQDNNAGPTGGASNEVANIENPGAGSAFFSRLTGSTGGTSNNSETRPRNVALAGYIKF